MAEPLETAAQGVQETTPTATEPAVQEVQTQASPQVQQPASDPVPHMETALGGEPPIEYTQFNVPDGFEAPDDAFLGIAKELGIKQEGVQKVVDYYTQTLVPKMLQEQATKIEEQNNAWKEECTKTLGQEGMDRARNAFRQFATPELTKLMNDTGLGSHPALVAMFAEIGKQMGEGTLVKGNTVTTPKRAADILFG